MTRSVEALFSGLLSGNRPATDETGGQPALALDDLIAALKNKAHRISAPCPFAVGDVVTARADSDIKGAGEPHVVIELIDPPFVDHKSETGSNQFLRQFTMRVAHFHGDSITQHAVDHGSFETWTAVHAERWLADRKPERAAEAAFKATADLPLTDIIRRLRSEQRRLADAKITWKKGDLVEILGYQTSNAAEPMAFNGRSIGLVEVVDTSDETTRVIYFDHEGDRRTQWFKPIDLKPFTLETVTSDNEP